MEGFRGLVVSEGCRGLALCGFRSLAGLGDVGVAGVVWLLARITVTGVADVSRVLKRVFLLLVGRGVGPRLTPNGIAHALSRKEVSDMQPVGRGAQLLLTVLCAWEVDRERDISGAELRLVIASVMSFVDGALVFLVARLARSRRREAMV